MVFLTDVPTPSAFQNLLTSVGAIIAAAITWMGTFLHTLTTPGNELLLIFVLLPIIGVGIGLIRRMLHV